MSQGVLAVGVLVAAPSMILLLHTGAMTGLLTRVLGSRWLYGAALLRLLLGATLIAGAGSAHYPQLVAMFGWLLVLGGLILVAVPAPVVARVAARFGQLSPAASRLWLCGALLFGLFLIYAALV